PVGKRFELTSSQAPLRARNASDADAHTRRLPGDLSFFCDRFGRDDDPVRDKTRSAFVLAREDEDPVAFRDVLATIHRFLRVERERRRAWVANLGFDRERHKRLSANLIAQKRMRNTACTSCQASQQLCNLFQIYCFDFAKICSEYCTQSQDHYEKNPSSYGGISHM